jgi:hypothetical protein
MLFWAFNSPSSSSSSSSSSFRSSLFCCVFPSLMASYLFHPFFLVVLSLFPLFSSSLTSKRVKGSERRAWFVWMWRVVLLLPRLSDPLLDTIDIHTHSQFLFLSVLHLLPYIPSHRLCCWECWCKRLPTILTPIIPLTTRKTSRGKGKEATQ